MNLVKTMGGLGNQLFQYSFAQYVEKIIHEPVRLDTLHFLFHPERPFALNKLSIRFRRSGVASYLWYRMKPSRFIRFEEKTFNANIGGMLSAKNRYFWGYWQKAEYAQAGRETILKGLAQFPKRPRVMALAQEINESDSLSIHIRRGDYRKIPKFRLLSEDYYKAAFDAVEAEEADKWYVFSDERDLEKGLIPINKKVINIAQFKLEDYEEFFLMSLCRRNICANSTFSWWASFLNEREGRRIVIPKRWKTIEDGFNIKNYLFDDISLL